MSVSLTEDAATLQAVAKPLMAAIAAARGNAQRQMSMNNLKQIGLAMHNYHDVNKRFPPAANLDAAGKPLLSWRVHILPYLEQEALYKQFKLDEPWDSEHNKKLAEIVRAHVRRSRSESQTGHDHLCCPDRRRDCLRRQRIARPSGHPRRNVQHDHGRQRHARPRRHLDQARRSPGEGSRTA